MIISFLYDMTYIDTIHYYDMIYVSENGVSRIPSKAPPKRG